MSETPEEVLARRKAEAARQEAKGIVGSRLRELASNILRVVRGAGKPSEIRTEANELLKAMIEYREATGHWPAPEDLASELDFREEWEPGQRNVAEELREHAKETVVRGALQIAASRLIGQTTQERAGESELHEGIRGLETAQQENRKRCAAEQAKVPGRRAGKRKPRTSSCDGI